MRPKHAIAWTNAVPEFPLRFRPILSPEVGQKLYVTVLSSRIVGVLTHFVHSRVRPCVGLEAGCEGCLAKRAKRWKGYLAVWWRLEAREAIAEITAQGGLDNKALLSASGPDLRGWQLTMWRRGRKVNGPSLAEFAPPPVGGPEVPPSFDVARQLCHIWGLDESLVDDLALPSEQ
jgi:hypothetical protein